MGGGDLNLKKSWHPQTRKNLEKLWLAERDALNESKKIEEIRKEKREQQTLDELKQLHNPQSASRSSLDWMYSNKSCSNKTLNEDVLLGKRRFANATASINQPQAPEHGNAAIFCQAEQERKAREDPLMLIKKKAHKK